MKTFTRSFFLLPALMAGLGLMPAGRASAQGFTNLHSFTYGNDGAFPYGGVILSGNTLYGVTEEGGNGRYGTVFAYTNGGGYSTLHSFSYNSDGGYPIGSLVLSGNTLYGTTLEGGANGDGTVFALNTDGSGFRTLYSFSAGSDNASGYYVNSDGAYPEAGLVLSGNTLYGTTVEGGTSGEGTVFALNTDGSGFTNLYDFTGGSDGGYPYTGLVLSGNTLYGTTVVGGTKNAGTVFAINTNSSNFRILHSFIYASDGEEPEGGLILAGNTLYGTASYGGTHSVGTVFAINTNGSGFMNLHNFAAVMGTNSSGYYINIGGAYPRGELVVSGNTLYGTASEGGTNGGGTIFAINISGSGFTELYDFSGEGGNSDGAYPSGGLVLSGNTLYGTTGEGGTSNEGALFAFLTYFLQITAGPTNGQAPLTVNFSSAGVDNYGNAIIGWNWTFGDGSSSAAQNPSHTYTGPGSFSPSLVATNSNGLLIFGSLPSITVTEPTMVFTANPTNGPVPLQVSFATPGLDSAGNVISHWNWAFGDGSTSTAQNPSHTYTNDGIYYPVLVAGNNLGGPVAVSGPAFITTTNAAVYSGLVLNGGFGTGDFNSGWTVSGAPSNNINVFVDNGSQSGTTGITPYSGEYVAALGPVGSLSYLSQTLATSAGANYLLSLWLDSPDGETPNEFLVSWNGTNVFNETNIPAIIGWTNLQFLVAATATNTVLEFGFRDDFSWLGLDQVSVTPVSFSISSVNLSGTNLLLKGNSGVPGATNYTLASTNLALPLSQWTRVATNVSSASGNFTITVTNTVTPGAGRRFYILQLK
jgi:uncharacterized repeat protein (TIGR03803 family)